MSGLWHLVAQALHGNQFFNGGFVLMALGALGAGLRTPLRRLQWWLQSQCFVYIEVTNFDPAYEYLQEWLANLPRAKRFRTLSVTSREKGGANVPLGDPMPVMPEKANGVRFSPSPGTHFAFFERRLIWIERYRNEDAQTHGTVYKESITLKVFCRDPGAARRLVERAVESGRPHDRRMLTVWHLDNWNNGWAVSGRRLPRPLASVLLPDGELEQLLADCARYLAARDWYEALGIPYRRGYLLHGRPGSGKTSTVAAIASHFHCDIYVLALSANSLCDQVLQKLVARVPAGDILLLEDVDALMVSRASAAEGKEEILAPGVSFSGLLNALDGIHTSEGRLLFMTTNHPEKLDPALIRPGRIDYQVEFGAATFEQAERLFQRFFPDAPESESRAFARRIPAGQFTMAQLLQHLLVHVGDPGGALAQPLPVPPVYAGPAS